MASGRRRSRTRRRPARRRPGVSADGSPDEIAVPIHHRLIDGRAGIREGAGRPEAPRSRDFVTTTRRALVVYACALRRATATAAHRDVVTVVAWRHASPARQVLLRVCL